MSKSAILSSSIAKKYWMALTGLFLCTFLIGHLLGNLQLIYKFGEDGRRAFNEYAYFMQHNIFIKILSYVTYASILFHAIDGSILSIRNAKARPQGYAYSKPSANSSSASRNMGILGTAILVFIVTHMVNFWAKMHFDTIPLHQKTVSIPSQMGGAEPMSFYLTTEGSYVPAAQLVVKHETFLYPGDGQSTIDLRMAEGYKDLHSVVFAFFGQDANGIKANPQALWATLLYVLAMAVLAFHLWHGFASAFQTLGLNHKRYNALIKGTGQVFAIIVPFLFALIPVMIFMGKAN